MSESGTDFVALARGLALHVAASAEEIEQSRRLPLALVEAIAEAGLFRLWMPRSLGGAETDPMTLVGVVEEIARADGAADWCVAIAGDTAHSAAICRRTPRVKFTVPIHA